MGLKPQIYPVLRTKKPAKIKMLRHEVRAEKLRVDLAVAIARKREEEGLSQSVIARLAHLSQQQVSKIENGENCNIDTYFKAMAALGMNFHDVTV